MNRSYFLGDNRIYTIEADEILSYTTATNLPEALVDTIETIGRYLHDRYYIRTPLVTLMATFSLVDRILAGEGFWTGNFYQMTYDELAVDSGINDAQQLTTDTFTLWQQQVQTAGGKLAIVHMALPTSYIAGEFVASDQLIFDTLESLNIPLILTLDALHQAIQNGIDIDYFAEFQDHHLTPQGNHELATVIFNWLVGQGIVPAE